MKIAVFSDLHLEFHNWEPPTDLFCDVVVLAGDIDVISRHGNVPAWAKAKFPGREIVWVLGNHEFYAFAKGLGACRELASWQARAHAVHLLEMDSVVIGGTRILGCTLWTDFALRRRPAEAMTAASLGMNDFRGAIRLKDGDEYRWFRPSDSVAMHEESVAWLDRELSKPFPGPSVVVTHHSPHPNCEHRFYERSPLSPAFCSNLEWLIKKHQPALWISGHTHASHDIRIGTTRLVSNQRGYRETPEHADAPFNPRLVVEI